jgi:mevalonate kinase
MKSVTTHAFGKWILTGEHAVLRGVPALVFPVLSRSVDLTYTADGPRAETVFAGPYGNEFVTLFSSVMERAMGLIGKPGFVSEGSFRIESSIPAGAGMGASAALCVSVGRWCVAQGWVAMSELSEFSRQLENLFHGESSGVDIAVAISGRGLHFERARTASSGARHDQQAKLYAVIPQWSPQWYVSFSGRRGVTKDCIAKVKALWERDARLAASIDRDMGRATELAEAALALSSREAGFGQLAEAIDLAASAFQRWGLADGAMGEHLHYLKSRGARAVKPTGSGDGGFALSLWQEAPPADVTSQLIKL